MMQHAPVAAAAATELLLSGCVIMMAASLSDRLAAC
jgi:hypothetical protein